MLDSTRNALAYLQNEAAKWRLLFQVSALLGESSESRNRCLVMAKRHTAHARSMRRVLNGEGVVLP